jgi:predicted NAD-dependent protein-ADP-ribosyltransferase YbiA (DUF1768 family)
MSNNKSPPNAKLTHVEIKRKFVTHVEENNYESLKKFHKEHEAMLKNMAMVRLIQLLTISVTNNSFDIVNFLLTKFKHVADKHKHESTHKKKLFGLLHLAESAKDKKIFKVLSSKLFPKMDPNILEAAVHRNYNSNFNNPDLYEVVNNLEELFSKLSNRLPTVDKCPEGTSHLKKGDAVARTKDGKKCKESVKKAKGVKKGSKKSNSNNGLPTVDKCPEGTSHLKKGKAVARTKDGKKCKESVKKAEVAKKKSNNSNKRDPALPVVDVCPKGSSTRAKGKLIAYTTDGKECRRPIADGRVREKLRKRFGAKPNNPKLATRIGKMTAKIEKKVTNPNNYLADISRLFKSLKNNVPKKFRVPEIRINSPKASTKTSEFTLSSNDNVAKFVIYRNAPNVKPGKGNGERGSANSDLSKISNWRLILSDMHVDLKNPIVIKGKTYASVEHYLQAMKFRSTAPRIAEEFTMNSGSDYAKDPELAIQAAMKESSRVDPAYEGRFNTIRKGALFTKFIRNKKARKVLHATGNAKLMVMGSSGSMKRDELLEQTRESLGKGQSSSNKNSNPKNKKTENNYMPVAEKYFSNANHPWAKDASKLSNIDIGANMETVDKQALRKALDAKVAQHSSIRKVLTHTKDARLVEINETPNKVTLTHCKVLEQVRTSLLLNPVANTNSNKNKPPSVKKTKTKTPPKKVQKPVLRRGGFKLF